MNSQHFLRSRILLAQQCQLNTTNPERSFVSTLPASLWAASLPACTERTGTCPLQANGRGLPEVHGCGAVAVLARVPLCPVYCRLDCIAVEEGG